MLTSLFDGKTLFELQGVIGFFGQLFFNFFEEFFSVLTFEVKHPRGDRFDQSKVRTDAVGYAWILNLYGEFFALLRGQVNLADTGRVDRFCRKGVKKILGILPKVFLDYFSHQRPRQGRH